MLPGPDGIKKTLAVGLTNVYFEGTKTLVHEVSRGKSLEESVEKAQTSMVRKSGEVVYTSVIGSSLDKVPGLAGTKFGAGEGTQKTISNVMKGITATTGEVYDRAHDNMTVADKNISQHLTEDFNNWKNAQAEKLF